MRYCSRRIGALLRSNCGMVTVEAALSLAALVIVCAALLSALGLLAAQLSLTASAGAAARAVAIGIDPQTGLGPQVQVQVTEQSGWVAVQLRRSWGAVTLQATAQFPAENREP